MKKYLLTGVLYLGGMVTATYGQTTFTGPVNIQNTFSPTAALCVQRYGTQPSAMDLFANGSAGKALRILTPNGGSPQVMTYFSDTGEWYSRAKMVVSGVYTGALPTGSDMQSPSADPMMFGQWSDIEGPVMVIRCNPTNPTPPATNAALSTMDGTGKYRFSIFPDGSLNFAGSVSNTFNSAGFDTSLYRSGANQLSTSGNFSAAAIKDTSIAVTLTNGSGATVNDGSLVVINPNSDNSFLPATSDMDTKVLGVAVGNIAAGAAGQIALQGVRQVSVTGTINRGDRIVTSPTSGTGRRVAVGETPPAGAVIGKAAGIPVSGKAAVILSSM